MQRIFDATDVVLGYDPVNDLRMHEAAGVTIDPNKVVDVQLEYSKRVGAKSRDDKHLRRFKLVDAAAIVVYKWRAGHTALNPMRAQ